MADSPHTEETPEHDKASHDTEAAATEAKEVTESVAALDGGADAPKPAPEAAPAPADKDDHTDEPPVPPVVDEGPGAVEEKKETPHDPAPHGDETKPAPPAPKPDVAKPGRPPRPGQPGGMKRPGGPKPGKPVAPPAPPIDPKLEEEARTFGRVDEEGRVFLIAHGDIEEREVGQYAAEGDKNDALNMYVRRYLDLVAQASLLESRVDHVNPNELNAGLKALDTALAEPAVVGDIESLKKRVEALHERIATRRVEFEAERKAAKEQALADREAIIDQAEKIAAQDPAKTHWRDSRNELNGLLDQWKKAQKSGVRIDRKAEEALWKRFSRARTEFDRHRRQHFSKVEAERVEVTARKEALIARAQEMSDSTDWNATSAAYRDLLEEWKRAGRMSRRDDDKLWARFRAAQQVFFDARQAHFDSVDSEQSENLKAKLELVKEAQALLPIQDVKAAKEALHSIQDRWEEIGFVPRKDISRTEGKLREVENAIRHAEDDQWRQSDPAKKERVSDFASQLEDAIAKHEDELKKAEEAGDDKAAQQARESLEARRAWLDQLNS